MTGKKNSHSQYQPAQIGFFGFIAWGPPEASSSKSVASSGGGKRKWTDAFQSQSSTKAVYKSPGGGSSAKFTKTEKAGGFVEKRSGNRGYKQEVNYKTSLKVNDKARGSTTEYETQVKCKKTTTYHAPKKIKGATTAPKKTKGATTTRKFVTYYEDDDAYYY